MLLIIAKHLMVRTIVRVIMNHIACITCLLFDRLNTAQCSHINSRILKVIRIATACHSLHFVLFSTHQILMLDSLQNCPHMFCGIFLQDTRYDMGYKNRPGMCNTATVNLS